MTDDKKSIVLGLRELSGLANLVADAMAEEVAGVVALTRGTLLNGGRLFFAGNGGSAADAQHLAAEYIVRFTRNRRPLPALALTTDSSILTAGANDLGFDTVFSRQVEALAREGDLLFLHSTSGRSENLIRAAEVAGAMGVKTVALLARGGGPLAGMVDRALVVPTDSTARAQEIHLALGHLICQLAEEPFIPEGKEPVTSGEGALQILEESRKMERSQTHFYRTLAGMAEAAGDAGLSERFNALLADEQHHLSRLTARILELGGVPREGGGEMAAPSDLEGWEAMAREREEKEVIWYRTALEKGLDERSEALIREILESEEQQARELGGKWMSA